MIIETFRQAIQNVWSNKLRTFLTMLGIIIGVMAVIVIVGLGNGMTKSMRDSFSAMGTNTLNINVWGYGSRTISVDDVYAIAEKNPELIQSVSPQIDFSGSGDLKIGTSTYRWLNIYGVDEDYTTLKNYTIAKGRGLQYMDIKDNKQVCIIGDYLNRVAFGGNGVGQTLKIGANKFRIVGVLAAKVSDPSLQEGSDDACVYLPYTTVMRLSNTSTNQSYIAIMTDESKANDAKAVMEAGLYNVLKSENAYYVYSASEFLEEMNKMIHMVIVNRQHLAAGGRHRHHEHHAGVRHRAHPRDRHPQGTGCQGTGHPGAVRGGGCHHLGAGRFPRHRAGLCRLDGGQPHPAHGRIRRGCHRQPVVQLHRSGIRHLGGHRCAVRLPARQARRTAQPHRSPAV